MAYVFEHQKNQIENSTFPIWVILLITIIIIFILVIMLKYKLY
jgi:hypothetical protein